MRCKNDKGGMTAPVRARRPFTWQTLREGLQVVCESEEGGRWYWRVWPCPIFLLRRAYGLSAYNDTGLVRPEFFLIHRYLTFRQSFLTLPWQDLESADRVEVTFHVSKDDRT